MNKYDAPWSILLRIVTIAASGLCIGISVFLLLQQQPFVSWFGVLPVLLVLGSALFMIRGYTLTPNAILVHRLFWETRLPLAGLQSAQVETDAMNKSIRLFGNGGLFSFTGLFRNKHLGNYRAFVTDPKRTVVLRFSSGARTIVLSPGSPDQFVQQLTTNVGGLNQQ